MNPYRSLTLYSARPEDSRFAEALAEAATLPFAGALDPASFDAAAGTDSVFLVDAGNPAIRKSFEASLQRAAVPMMDPAWRDRVHYLHDSSEKLCREGMLVRDVPAGHFICRNSPGFGDDRAARQAAQHYSRVLWSRMNRASHGLSGLMSGVVALETLKFTESSQRSYAAEAIRHQLVDLRVRDRIADSIANTADELLMNAMFNAPHDAEGRPMYSRTARSANLVLEGRHRVELQFAIEDPYIGITVTDLFGSLERGTVLDFLSRGFDGRIPTQPSAEHENGGTGLATAFRTGASFVFRCEPGARTEVTVFYRRATSYQEFASQFQFISLDYRAAPNA